VEYKNFVLNQTSHSYLNGLNDLKMGMRIFKMIQEAGVIEPLEVQAHSQISVKWRYEIVDWFSD
jgi:hypothetical protein